MIKEVVRFLWCPSPTETFQQMSFGGFFRLLILKFALALPFIFLFTVIEVDQFDHAFSFEEDENKMVLGFFVVLFAPLLEESIFRLHLNLKKSNILWGLGLSFLIFRENWVPFALTFLYLAFLLFAVLRKKTPELKWVIFISAVLFGLVHMANYSEFDYGKYFYLIPILIGSQVVGGLLLGYVRLNYGMKWAILNHASFNAILFLPTLFLE